MYDKKKCGTCKYHAKTAGMQVISRGKIHKPGEVMCAYSLWTLKTCLQREGNKIVDRRGEDPENCQLYAPGKPKAFPIPGQGLTHDE